MIGGRSGASRRRPGPRGEAMRARRVPRTLAAAATLSSLLAACGGGDPYRVETSLASAIRALGSADIDESEAAAERILAFGRAALPALDRALAREGPAIRKGVIEVLERYERDSEIAGLVVRTAAHDSDVAVRATALRTLSGYADPRARAVVEAALFDAEPQIRMEAAAACAELCVSPAALARLVELALHEAALPAAVAARGAAIRILAGGDSTRSQALRLAIGAQVGAALAAPDPATALRAALLASDVGDPSGRAILARALGEDIPALLRLQATHALGTIGTSAEIPALVALQRQPGLAEYAYDALRRLAEREVVGASEALEQWQGPRPPAPLGPPPGAR